ncbi:hypothetical protein BTVI_147555 [Pitangus sulphuratus]|nr:hypothetical protein BTVI_147555 [Pitangus sulphuratus]
MADRSLESVSLPLEVRARLAELELELSEEDAVWPREVAWVTLGKVKKLCVGRVEPGIATVMLNFVFDCGTFQRHLVTSG